jgi:hypothetical protein
MQLAEAQKEHGEVPKTITGKAATRWSGHYTNLKETNYVEFHINPILEGVGKSTLFFHDMELWGEEVTGGSAVEVDFGMLQLTPTEKLMSRELEAVLKQPYVVTEKIQGENAIPADQQYELIYSLYKYMSSPNTSIRVPRRIEWPLTKTLVYDVRKPSDLTQPVQLLRTGIAEELFERIISKVTMVGGGISGARGRGGYTREVQRLILDSSLTQTPGTPGHRAADVEAEPFAVGLPLSLGKPDHQNEPAVCVRVRRDGVPDGHHRAGAGGRCYRDAGRDH